MCFCCKLGLKIFIIIYCIVIEFLYDFCLIYFILFILVLVYVGFIVFYNVIF